MGFSTTFSAVKGTIDQAFIDKGNIFDLTIENIIRSSNYVQGVSGFLIARDGDAQFEAANIIGELSAETATVQAATITGTLEAEHIDADVRNVAVLSSTAAIVSGSSVVQMPLLQSIQGWGELLFLVGDVRVGETYWFTTSVPVASVPVYQVGSTFSNAKIIVWNQNGDARNIQVWRSANYRTLYVQRLTPRDTTHRISRIVAVRDPTTVGPPPVLAAAVAPNVTIVPVASVGEDQTQDLTAQVSGGTYDTLEYAWVVVSGGGSISGSGANVVYDPPDVAVDTAVTVQCEVIARGTGASALNNTSDNNIDIETFTVNFVDPTTLPAAEAPFITIAAVGSVDEDDTQALSASVVGGIYDTLEYLWSVLSGGGIISGAGANVVYNPPDVAVDTPVNVRCQVRAHGTGTIARDETEDTAADQEPFTVNFVDAATVSVSGHIITHITGGSSAAGVRFNRYGSVDAYYGAFPGQIDQDTDWVIPRSSNVGNNYQVRAAYSGQGAIVDGALDTWLSLAAGAGWSLRVANGSGLNLTGTLTVSIRRAGTSAVLASGDYILTAENTD